MRLTVNPPTPVSSEFGLYSVATVRDLTDPHANAGVQYEPVSPGVASLGEAGCEFRDDLAASLGMESVELDPFVVWAGPECGSLLGYEADEFVTRARTALSLSEERSVERALATGEPFAVGSPSPRLAAPVADVTVLSAIAVKPKTAVGLIEEALGNASGAKGVIHAPRRAAGLLTELVEKTGPRLTTKLGSPVAFGAGYTGQAPVGAAPVANVVWLYATGPVLVTRTETFEPGGDDVRLLVDRTTNALTVVTARIVSVGFEGLLAAVPLSLEE